MLGVFWYGLQPSHKEEPAPAPVPHEVSKAEHSPAVKELIAQASVGMPEPRLREVAANVSGWFDSAPPPAAPETQAEDVKSSAVTAGLTALAHNDFDLARDSFLSILYSDPNDLRALKGLEAASRGLSSVDSGEVSDAAGLRGDIARGFEQRATSSFQDGDLEAALKSAQVVVSLTPEGGSSHQAAQQLIQEALAAKSRQEFQATR